MTTRDIITSLDSAGYALGVIDGAGLLPSTKEQYKRVIKDYTDKGLGLLNASDLKEYANNASNSRRSFLKAVVNRIAEDVKQNARQSVPPDKATPENMAKVQAWINQAEAVTKAIETEEQKGQKAHTWLSGAEVKELLNACKVRRSGNPEFEIVTERDRLAIGLMVAAGLRRREAIQLRFEDVIKEPGRALLNVTGKGNKDRIIPISENLADAIEAWGERVGREGYILRSLGRDKTPGDSLSTTGLYNIVQKRGELMGFPELQPHDLRRSYAELGRQAGIPISQISILLGHADTATTETYLNIRLDKSVTISDFVPF